MACDPCSALLGIFFTLIYFFILTGSDDSSDFQGSLPAEVIWGVVGQDVDLPCDITPAPNDKVNMVLWFKDTAGGIPLFSLDARDGKGDLDKAVHWATLNDVGARTYFHLGDRSMPSRLTINKVQPTDEGIFRCRIDFYNSPTKNFRVNLTLVVPPSDPIIYNSHGQEVTQAAGPFLEGFDLFLSCQVSGGRPRPDVTWWKDNQLIDSTMEVVTSSLIVNQLFIQSVSREMLGIKFECRASNSNETMPKVRVVPCDIYLKPRSVRLTHVSEMLSAGRPQQYQCETWGSIPPAKISWLLEGEKIRNAAVTAQEGFNSSSSLLTYRPKAEDNGRELVCRAENVVFPGGMIENRTYLIVHYPPNVTIHPTPETELNNLKEGDTIEFVCRIHSNPAPTHISWFHGDMYILPNTSKGYIGERNLKIVNTTEEQAGEYSCAARNIEGEARSQPIKARVQFAPRCKPSYLTRTFGALRHEKLLIRCEVEADPADDNIKFSWTFGHNGDVLPIQSSRVISSRTTSHIDFMPNSDKDFGTLSCWASNSVGRQRVPCVTHIQPAKVPETPTDCVLRNRSVGGLEVNCKAGHDGGIPQHFLLEVTEVEYPQETPTPTTLDELNIRSNHIPHSLKPPVFKILGSEPMFVLHGLEAGKDYQLSVYGVNGKGRSEPPVIIPKVRFITTSAKLTSTESDVSDGDVDDSNHTVMLIALGTLVGVAVLIVAGIAMTTSIVLCRKRQEPEHQLDQQDYEQAIQEVHDALRKTDEPFVVTILNNTVRKSVHEVLPLEVNVNSLKEVHDVAPIETTTMVIRRPNKLIKETRRSSSFTPKEEKNEETKVTEPLLVKTSIHEDKQNGKCHPRVTLNAGGEIIRYSVSKESEAVRSPTSRSK